MGEYWDNVPQPDSDANATRTERASLAMEGFDLDDPWPEYGQQSLLKAYRLGWHDAFGTPREGDGTPGVPDTSV